MVPPALPFFPATENYHFGQLGSGRVTLTWINLGSQGYLLKTLVAVTKIPRKAGISSYLSYYEKECFVACEHDQNIKFKICMKFNLAKFTIVEKAN